MVDELDLEAKLLDSLARILVSELLGFLLCDEDKVLLQVEDAFLDSVLLGNVLVDGIEVDDETLLDTEDGVGSFVWVTPDVEGTAYMKRDIVSS